MLLCTIHAGDLTLAYQSFRVSAAANTYNAEALNALGVLDMRRNNNESARVFLSNAREKAPWLYEPFLNGGMS
jgi:tetratricopeptide repeat protein 8